jgi:hypothetical protein
MTPSEQRSVRVKGGLVLVQPSDARPPWGLSPRAARELAGALMAAAAEASGDESAPGQPESRVLRPRCTCQTNPRRHL